MIEIKLNKEKDYHEHLFCNNGKRVYNNELIYYIINMYKNTQAATLSTVQVILQTVIDAEIIW